MAFWQSVSPYLLFAALGIVAAVLLTAHNLRLTSLNAKQQTRVVLCGGLCFFPAALCANLGNWILFPRVWSLPFWTRFFAAGFTFYFGLISYLLFFVAVLSLLRVPRAPALFAAAPALPLFHAIARVGGLMEGCCYGIPWSFSLFGLTLDWFPVREAEMAGLLLVFSVLQWKIKEHRMAWYLLLYAILRFFLEYFRGDDRGVLLPFLPLSPSQQIAAVVFAAALGFLLLKGRSRNHIKRASFPAAKE